MLQAGDVEGGASGWLLSGHLHDEGVDVKNGRWDNKVFQCTLLVPLGPGHPFILGLVLTDMQMVEQPVIGLGSPDCRSSEGFWRRSLLQT